MTAKVFFGLSDDARVVAGISFAPLRAGGRTLSFGTPSRLTPRGRAALVELVEKGVVSMTGDPQGGPLTFVPILDCAPMAGWVGENLGCVDFDLVAAPDARDSLVWSDGSVTPLPAGGKPDPVSPC